MVKSFQVNTIIINKTELYIRMCATMLPFKDELYRKMSSLSQLLKKTYRIYPKRMIRLSNK